MATTVKTGRFSEKEKLRVRTLMQQGTNINTIAQKLNRSYISVYSLIQKQRVPKPSTIKIREYHKWDSEQYSKVLNLHANGMSYANIAKKLGCTEKSLQQFIYRQRKKLKTKVQKHAEIVNSDVNTFIKAKDKPVIPSIVVNGVRLHFKSSTHVEIKNNEVFIDSL